MVRHLRARGNNAPDVSIFAGASSAYPSRRVDAARHLKFKCVVERAFIEIHLRKIITAALRAKLLFLVLRESG